MTIWLPFSRQHFEMDFLHENLWISIKISLKFLPRGPVNIIPALVQIMAWHQPGNKPLSEPLMVSLLMHLSRGLNELIYCGPSDALQCTPITLTLTIAVTYAAPPHPALKMWIKSFSVKLQQNKRKILCISQTNCISNIVCFSSDDVRYLKITKLCSIYFTVII